MPAAILFKAIKTVLARPTALEEAALDAAVAINQVHGFFGVCPCGEQGRYGRSVRPTRLLCRGWPKYKAQSGAERRLRG